MTDGELHRARDGENAEFEQFLEAFHWPHFVLWQSALMLNGDRTGVLDVERQVWKSSDTLYNLACFYARRFARDRAPEDRRAALDRLREYLARQGEAEDQGAARAEARTDPAFTALRDDPDFTALTLAPDAEPPAPERTDITLYSGGRHLSWGWTRLRRNTAKPPATAA